MKLNWFANDSNTLFVVSLGCLLLVTGTLVAATHLDDLISVSAMITIIPVLACAACIPFLAAVGLVVSRPQMTFRVGATLCGMLLVGTLLGTVTNSTLFYSERLGSSGVAPLTRGALAAGIGGIVFTIACFALSRCVFGKRRQKLRIYFAVVLLSAVLGGAITSIADKSAKSDDEIFLLLLVVQQLAPAILSAALVINELTLQSDGSSTNRTGPEVANAQ